MSSERRVTVGLIYTATNLSGLVLYSIVGNALRTKWKTKFTHSFYILAVNLMIADLGYLFTNLVVMIPMTFAGDIYGDKLGTVLASANTLFFWAIMCMSSLIALDRFTTFVAPALNYHIFERPSVYVTVSVGWVIATLALIITTLLPCPKKFNHVRFHYLYACSKGASMTPFVVAVQAIPLLLAVVYVGLFLYIVKQRGTNQSQSQKSEKSLLIQGGLIAGMLLLQNASFWSVPRLVTSVWGPVITSSIGSLNSGINPAIYLVFNKNVRSAVAEMLGIKAANQPTAAGSRKPPTSQRNRASRGLVPVQAAQHPNEIGAAQS